MTKDCVTCIRCGEGAHPLLDVQITADGSCIEHSDCRARWEGMVVGAAIIAWAEAIRQTYGLHRCRACPSCGKASNAWIGKVCLPCWDATHPATPEELEGCLRSGAERFFAEHWDDYNGKPVAPLAALLAEMPGPYALFVSDVCNKENDR